MNEGEAVMGTYAWRLLVYKHEGDRRTLQEKKLRKVGERCSENKGETKEEETDVVPSKNKE